MADDERIMSDADDELMTLPSAQYILHTYGSVLPTHGKSIGKMESPCFDNTILIFQLFSYMNEQFVFLFSTIFIYVKCYNQIDFLA